MGFHGSLLVVCLLSIRREISRIAHPNACVCPYLGMAIPRLLGPETRSDQIYGPPNTNPGPNQEENEENEENPEHGETRGQATARIAHDS
jgi:hypothetical protein